MWLNLVYDLVNKEILVVVKNNCFNNDSKVSWLSLIVLFLVIIIILLKKLLIVFFSVVRVDKIIG